MKKSCVTACPVEWPDDRGLSGRIRVEWVAGSPWNRWSDAYGMGGQMTVESAVDSKTLAYIYGRKYRRITLHTTHSQIPTTQKASYCLS